MRYSLILLAAVAWAAPPFPPTVRLVGDLPDTVDLAAFHLSGPWTVEEVTRGLDACVEGDFLVVRTCGEGPALGLVHLSSARGALVVPVTREPLHTVEFRLPAGGAREASVAGSFNGWNPSALRMELGSDGVFRATVGLPPGTHTYKFVVDGRWIPDPSNPHTADDGLGGKNSVVVLESGTSPARFVKKTFRNGTMVWSLFPPEEQPSAIVVLRDGEETEFQFSEGLLRVDARGGSLVRVLGLDAQGRPLRESWAWLEQGVPRGLPGTSGRPFDTFIYSLFPDRFRNGDPSNDAPLQHPALHPRVNYQGGDLQGIVDALQEGYFDSLGVNTLWLGPLYPGPSRVAFSPLDYTDSMRALSAADLRAHLEALVDTTFGAASVPIPPEAFPPVLAYSGYHGYWPAADRAIEPRFGTTELMQHLVSQAHARGIRLMLDLVPHHVHEDHPWVRAHPDWFLPLELPDGTLNLRHWDTHRLTTWFDPFLPTLNLQATSPAVDSVVASAVWWAKTFALDGFRHDATKHIPHEFWRALTAGLLDAGLSLLQVGETFGSRRLVGSYAVPAEMDGQFDFNLFYAARPLFAGQPDASFVQVMREVEESLAAFGALHLMANITGSHDQVRFVTVAQGDIPPGANDRLWGWTHVAQVRDVTVYRRLQLFFLFNLSVPGIPVLYYGDEIGLPGAGDPDNRRMMRFGPDLTPEERAHLAAMRALGRLKRDLPALTFGDLVVLHVEEKAAILARTFFDHMVIVAFNLGSTPWSHLLPRGAPVTRLVARWGEGRFNQYAGTLRVNLPAWSALVLSTE